MTREQAKQTLIGFGISEPTEEQVTSYLDSISGEIRKEKEKNTALKAKADKADELQKQLEELEQQNMTDAEKLEAERQKEKEANEKRISDLEKALAESNRKALTSDISSLFANAGLTGDAYAGAIRAFSAMSEEDAMKEAESFVRGVSEANKTALETAKATWEKDVLDKTPNPGGGKSREKQEETSAAADYAKRYSARMNPETEPVNDNAPANF